MKGIKVVSIDLAKNVFQVCAFNEENKVVFNKKFSRLKLIDCIRQFEPTTVVVEACYTAHPWGREIQALGPSSKADFALPSKAFVVGGKNDQNDAVAIAEASLRPKASFVAVKTLEQQDLQSLERIRTLQLKHRTDIANQLRGLLAEYGIVLPKQLNNLRKQVPQVLEDEQSTLTSTARKFIRFLYQEITQFDEKIDSIESELAALVKHHPDFQRLNTIPGVGPRIATQLIASVGDAQYFKNGRQMAAWIGLTPLQHASGEKSYHKGIT